MLHLKDLSEIGRMTLNRISKQYLNEAIASYRAGAYRASIISTWIAVCVDIIEKIKELSVGGDSVATQLEEKLNSIQPNNINGMLEFERKILDYACDELELITVIEKKHLDHLKEDRHFCAHPTFSKDGSQFTPSPELTKAYIVQASTYLLAKTPVKGKVVIDRLYNLISGNSFPEDDENAFIILSSDNYLGRVKDSTVRNLIIILLKRLFRDPTSLSQELLTQVCSSFGAIERLYPDIYIEVFSGKLGEMLAATNDLIIKRTFPFLAKRQDAWGYIEEAIIIRLETTIVSMDGKELNKYWVPQLASNNPRINNILQARIEEIEEDDIKNLLKGNPAKSLKDIAINIFINSGSFDSAYSNGINYLIPHASYYDDNDLEKIFTGILNNQRYNINQILNSGGMDEVFCKLYKEIKNMGVLNQATWQNFYANINDYLLNFEEFKKTLADDGVITIEETKQELLSDEVPF